MQDRGNETEKIESMHEVMGFGGVISFQKRSCELVLCSYIDVHTYTGYE